jgi:hypothetical protein
MASEESEVVQTSKPASGLPPGRAMNPEDFLDEIKIEVMEKKDIETMALKQYMARLNTQYSSLKQVQIFFFNDRVNEQTNQRFNNSSYLFRPIFVVIFNGLAQIPLKYDDKELSKIYIRINKSKTHTIDTGATKVSYLAVEPELVRRKINGNQCEFYDFKIFEKVGNFAAAMTEKYHEQTKTPFKKAEIVALDADLDNIEI